MRFAFAGAVVRSHWIGEMGRVVIALGLWRIPIARSRAGWSGTRPPADPRHPTPRNPTQEPPKDSCRIQLEVC